MGAHDVGKFNRSGVRRGEQGTYRFEVQPKAFSLKLLLGKLLLVLPTPICQRYSYFSARQHSHPFPAHRETQDDTSVIATSKRAIAVAL